MRGTLGRDDVVCGETVDHDERVTYEDAFDIQWTCDGCGAEWWEDKEPSE